MGLMGSMRGSSIIGGGITAAGGAGGVRFDALPNGLPIGSLKNV